MGSILAYTPAGKYALSGLGPVLWLLLPALASLKAGTTDRVGDCGHYPNMDIEVLKLYCNSVFQREGLCLHHGECHHTAEGFDKRRDVPGTANRNKKQQAAQTRMGERSICARPLLRLHALTCQ